MPLITLPDTFDAWGYVRLLQRLRTQRDDEVVYAPVYDRSAESSLAGALAISTDTPLVVTEGNYLLMDEGPWSAVRPLLDEAWYLELDDTVRRERLLERHMRFGRTREDALQWMAQTDEPNALRIAATRSRADTCFSLDN